MSLKNWILAIFLLLISACSPGYEGNFAAKNLSSFIGTPGEVFKTEVCYQSSIDSCHETTGLDGLETPEDYDYLDHNNPQYRKPDHFIDLAKEGTNELVSLDLKRNEFLSLSKGRYGILSPLLVEKIQKIRDAIGQPVTICLLYTSPSPRDS